MFTILIAGQPKIKMKIFQSRKIVLSREFVFILLIECYKMESYDSISFCGEYTWLREGNLKKISLQKNPKHSPKKHIPSGDLYNMIVVAFQTSNKQNTFRYSRKE